MDKYVLAEKFKSIQGEGLYAGCPMAFVRFVGCSVGKKVCSACDTDFEKSLVWRGGGEFTADELVKWTFPYEHICLTGGEPFDQDLLPFLRAVDLMDIHTPRLPSNRQMVHVETSGTTPVPDWLPTLPNREFLWICVSPKPGYTSEWIELADEVKVIVPGLGNGAGWPTPEIAEGWASHGKLVFLQPRNGKYDVDQVNLRYVQDLLAEHPEFRLSTQAHKILKVQ
jgi:organic radical activating enzyme